jgi:hypothetical protein
VREVVDFWEGSIPWEYRGVKYGGAASKPDGMCQRASIREDMGDESDR